MQDYSSTLYLAGRKEGLSAGIEMSLITLIRNRRPLVI